MAGEGLKREAKIEGLTFRKPPLLKLPGSKKTCYYDHSETKCINPQKQHLKGFPQPINPSASKTHLIDLKVVPKFWVCHSILDRFKANLSNPIHYLTPLLTHRQTEGFSILSSKKQNQRRQKPFFEPWRESLGSNNPSRNAFDMQSCDQVREDGLENESHFLQTQKHHGSLHFPQFLNSKFSIGFALISFSKKCSILVKSHKRFESNPFFSNSSSFLPFLPAPQIVFEMFSHHSFLKFFNNKKIQKVPQIKLFEVLK